MKASVGAGGMATLYYKALSMVPSLEVLAHRTPWTFVFFGKVLALRGWFGEAWALLPRPMHGRVLLAARIVSVIW